MLESGVGHVLDSVAAWVTGVSLGTMYENEPDPGAAAVAVAVAG